MFMFLEPFYFYIQGVQIIQNVFFKEQGFCYTNYYFKLNTL